jgi:tetratricopeptide (TPR) repeat protein
MTRLRRIFFASAACAVVAACGWDPSRPFDREAPQVNEALTEYDAGEAGSAAELLEDYLATGGCAEGNIGTPPRVRERANGSFDLSLALFKIAEQYGHRFGDEENDAGFLDPNLGKMRQQQVDCALRVVRAVAEDTSQPLALRARARYLEGNLLFLTGAYKEAVTAYEKALELIPAMGDSGPIGANAEAGPTFAVDPIGRDAAWNRAVALRRIEDKKDAGNDAAPPDGGNGDGGKNDNPDGGSKDQNQDGGNENKNKDGGNNDDKGKDGGKDGGNNDKNKDEQNQNKDKDQPDAAPPPPPSRQNQDDRILDQLENAPTVQQEAAKKQARQRRVKGTADK